MSTTDLLPPQVPLPGAPPPAPFPERVKSPRRSALELVLALVAIVAVAVATGYVDLLIVVASIIVIVMLHELGHFLVAKRSGMKVTEYFIGFGPRLWSFRRGETEYGVKALPLGGYVKIPGMTNLEEVDPADEGRLYRDKPFHSRLAVAVAGSAVHFLLALVLLFVLFTFVGVPNSSQVQIEGLNTVGGRPGPAAGRAGPGSSCLCLGGSRSPARPGRRTLGRNPRCPGHRPPPGAAQPARSVGGAGPLRRGRRSGGARGGAAAPRPSAWPGLPVRRRRAQVDGGLHL